MERGLKVDSTPSVTGAWYWVDDKKLHFRPKEYWPAHATVQVRSNLEGIKIGDRLRGDAAKPLTIRTGDRVIAVTDAAAHQLTVHKNGEEIKQIPVTTGKPGFETRNGVKVVLAKERFVRMRSTTVGIAEGSAESYDLDVHFATRVTWSGEYVHAAPWSVGSQGYANVSHGCVGMSTADAEWFFDTVREGDLVEVVNSDGDTMEPFGNGFGDWNLNWDKWREGSALTGSGRPRPRPGGGTAAALGRVRSAQGRRARPRAARRPRRWRRPARRPQAPASAFRRSSEARAFANSTGSTGSVTAASARLQVASQASCGRPISSSTGGQLKTSSLICRHRPMPPIGTASPSRTHTSMPPRSSSMSTAAGVAHSTNSTTGTSGAGRRPVASRTCSRVLASSL